MNSMFPEIENKKAKSENSESKDYKVDLETAIKTLDDIEEIYGENKQYRDVFIDAIRRGSLLFDTKSENITYILKKPIGELKEIVFEEPNADTMHEIAKGDILRASQKGEVEYAHSSNVMSKAFKTLNKVCNVPISSASKIKKRDWDIIVAICDFLV